jgi:hypothetical protein
MVAACIGLGLIVLMGLADIAEPLLRYRERQRYLREKGWLL